MKFKLACIVWGATIFYSLAQEENYKVVAEPGDGIYSILRKQGLDPVEHYKTFIELNEENIKDGSFLHVGREYYIPYVSDSFKNTGIRILLSSGEEEPVFEDGLEKLSRKSNVLKDAVYYLITEANSGAPNSFAKDIERNLTKTLLENGAHVFVLEQKGLDFSNKEDAERELMGSYIEAINRRYLKHSGKYQRLLIVRANGAIQRKMDISVYHHGKSKEGQRLAQNIRQAFQKNSVKAKSFKEVEAIFKDNHSLFLAKNVLPAVSLLDIDGKSRESKAKSIEVVSNKEALAKWLANGIFKDYADLEFEE